MPDLTCLFKVRSRARATHDILSCCERLTRLPRLTVCVHRINAQIPQSSTHKWNSKMAMTSPKSTRLHRLHQRHRRRFTQSPVSCNGMIVGSSTSVLSTPRSQVQTAQDFVNKLQVSDTHALAMGGAWCMHVFNAGLVGDKPHGHCESRQQSLSRHFLQAQLTRGAQVRACASHMVLDHRTMNYVHVLGRPLASWSSSIHIGNSHLLTANFTIYNTQSLTTDQQAWRN